jgi:hypothetical protein
MTNLLGYITNNFGRYIEELYLLASRLRCAQPHGG